MYRNTYTPSSSSAGPPPPAHGYEGYDRAPPPPQYPPGDGPSRPWNDHAQQDRRDDYTFRGPYSDLRRTHPDDRRRSDGEYRDRDRDNYRPPQGDFTFRVEPPPGLESYDSYRPREREQRNPRQYDSYWPQPPAHHTHGSRNSYGDQRTDPQQSRRDDGRRGYPRRNEDRRHQQRSQRPNNTGRRNTKPRAADRLLLIKKHDENPELMLGASAGRVTYRDVDELSDSDEAEMDISDASGSDVAEPASKRARTSDTTATKPEQDVPRWSNPDPYTALPPPDESSRKKKDMVQLIRKARVEAETKKAAAQVEGLDFISCDINDNDGTDGNGGDDTNGKSQNLTNSSHSTLSALRGATSTTLPPKPRSLPTARETDIESTDRRRASGANRDNPIDLTASTSLGNRKRTIDDTIKLPQKSTKPAKMRVAGGNVLPIWQPRDGNPCPWAIEDHRETPSMATRLHREIFDFYLWVSPRKFEEQIRNDLIKNLRTLIQKKWKDAELYPFGSFMSGLYLPTADMDIAICSESFTKRGSPKYDKKRHLWALHSHLVYYRVPADNEIEVISKAKVPLVKFTDYETSLKVDISFEKLDGHRAIKTFLDWKKKYPAMPILVSIIKHFLLMRGLNEPVSGGIGGFSVICMVVSLLDLMPQVQSRSMVPEHHLGEILMEFFDYYGNRFQYKTVAIRMNPPGLVPKSQVSNVVYRNMDRLSILDPNNPQNDIAGGSANTATILQQFSQAHATLKSRMAELSWGGDGTILEPLLAGNYSIFQLQRDHLERLSQRGGLPEYRKYTPATQW
ncbi:hypothetical protein F5Y05DRAFT_269196 [Hypoxylon sp. FL0543]|nr:hypothetical protein F5Y05DRAFT_269196 [Hypoxylon sp. FL0543]